MVKAISPIINTTQSAPKNLKEKVASAVQSSVRKGYSEEQLCYIETAMRADKELLNKYPFNREAIKSQQIREAMLKFANQK